MISLKESYLMSESPELKPQQSWRPTRIECLVVLGVLTLMVALLVPAIQHAREAARTSEAKNNLKQLGLALHNYHDNYSVFPPGGIFDNKGTPYHCWTTSLDPYMWAAPWYQYVDFNVPWDDPRQVDHFSSKMREELFEAPRTPLPPRPDGLPVSLFAANSWMFYRNSSVRLNQIPDSTGTLLLSEALGNHLPLGCPGNWRHVRAGLNQSEDSFGVRGRRDTLVLLVDGSVREFSPDTAANVWDALSGPATLKPTAVELEGTPFPYQLPTDLEWLAARKQFQNGVLVRMEGDSLTDWLGIDFKQTRQQAQINPNGNSYPNQLSSRISIEMIEQAVRKRDREIDDIDDVRIRGDLHVVELEPLLQLKNLKQLTLSTANIQGDVKTFRARLKPAVQVH